MIEHVCTPASFAHHAQPRYHLAPHLLVVDDVLLAAATRQVFAMVWMPPRHGKSELVSVHYPAWYLGHYPDRHVLLGSYAASLADGFSGRARDLIARHGDDYGGVQLDRSSWARNDWSTTLGGSMRSAGVGGGWTGHGGNLVIIDDPIKGHEQAQSKTVREAVWNWWQTDVSTRLEPNASVIVMQTRWHEDDLSGRLLADASWPWRVVNLPAVAHAGDVMGRAEGEALWPERWPLPSLERRRRALGSYWWSALYDQSPKPPTGALFNRSHFHYYDAVEDGWMVGGRLVAASSCTLFATADVASKTQTLHDYTVVAVWARTPDSDLLLLDVRRVKMEGPEKIGLLEAVWRAWRPAWIGVEDKVAGTDLLQHLKRKGVPVRALKADADKVTRALSAAALYEDAKIWHPREADWLGAWEDELVEFPLGAHDDQVDVVAYAARNQRLAKPARASRPRGSVIPGGVR